MDTVTVQLRRSTFEELQRIAIPLVDNTDALIAKLVEHWEHTPHEPSADQSGTLPTTKFWRSARGEALPVGLKLRALYWGKTYTALVTDRGIEFNGQVFDNPSSAGSAAKHAAGATGNSASTNGWLFWEMPDPKKDGAWVSINVLRK